MSAPFPPPSDTEFWDEVIDKVRRYDSGNYEIGFNDGMCTNVDADTPIAPEVGMTVRFYGRGQFYERRGLVLFDHDNRPWPVNYRSPRQYAADCAERSRQYEAEQTARNAEPMLPEPQIPGFEWVEGTRQISGFGGDYERMCRAMVAAGCKWMADHPDADPKFRGYKGVFGVISEDNADAEALSAAIVAPCPDCSGAMHQASVSHVMAWTGQFGRDWAAYQAHMMISKDDAS